MPNRGSMKQKSIIRDEFKEVGEEIVRKDQCLSEEEEFKTCKMARDGATDHGGYAIATLHPEIALQRQQPNPWSTICWEKFLPVRSLKVLLVESDDSTRQVVCALLRNCSYEVMAAANGLQALTILEDMSIHVDLVLTEVVMPGLSGIGLLNKIKSHKTCMNIPVIMMSSSGSMKTVFKCLSIGAVDFLVKPIRKNELKNLWQHVWRRCHSSSGSVSESGIQNRAPTRSKSADDSDNNTESSDEDESGSFGYNVRNGSDNGSGTQSSWTKCAVENESPHAISPSEKSGDRNDSICGPVIHPKSVDIGDQWVVMTTKKECQRTDDFVMGKDLEIGRYNTNSQNISYLSEKNHVTQTGFSCGKVNLSENDKNKEMSVDGMDHGSSNASGEPTKKEADLICGIDKNTAQFVRFSASPTTFTKILDCGYQLIEDVKELPSLELSLKRLRPSEEKATLTYDDDSNVLKHSSQPAFSRYNIYAASNQVPTDYTASCAPLTKSSEAVNMETTCNMISNSDAAPLDPGSSGGRKNNGVTINAFSKPVAYADETSTALAGEPAVIDSQVQVQVHHYHHHYHHHVHDKQQNQHKTPNDDSSHKNMTEPATHCDSSSMFPVPMEGIAANGSINGNLSGSNHGSNVHIRSSAAVNIGGSNGESDNGVTGKYVTGGGTGNDNSSRLASNRSAQREAALHKFRQKRKERNFGKKVRYHSRKRLAEQRPRVRGQFVRLQNNGLA